ncbi:glycine-tRNA synthetase subunit beta [Clostridiales bacterium PH28_bin88]|nr:glycine-tRNA synthetase subunit beta [Clostridiales bacterium PH28_bin88]
MDELVSLCKRRGIVFPSSEIYGGINSCWDFGPLGAELKRNIKEAWWQATIRGRGDCVGADTSIIMHPEVWRASGHLENFTDPLVDCKVCKQRFRADHLQSDRCPTCGGELTAPRQFNLMFKTFLGPVEETAAIVYLRPETAQGIFAAYKTIMTTGRLKPPFGIGQIGKSFRNEVSPGNFIFRSREFEQMELEYFVHPEFAGKAFEEWVEIRYRWYLNLGVNPSKIRIREHRQDELAHYAKACVDIEYLFPFGWQEIEGIAHRGDYDLRQHQKFSGENLTYFDETTKERYLPVVIESSAGVDRTLLTFLADSYRVESERTVLQIHPTLAPVKAAVFPLAKKPELVERARAIEDELRRAFSVSYDEAGSIGRRYRRQDEVGTPFGITVDFQTIEDGTVTLRERDSMTQERVHVARLNELLAAKLKHNV